MSHSGQKTVRFTQVVERSGEPHVHTLWLAPEKDAELKRAEKEHRVMMLQRTATGGKTDIGSVGFDLEAARHGQVLIFPKSLRRFEGARVVGVKFDLVEQPKFATAEALKAAATAPAYRVGRKQKKPSPEPPAPRRSNVEEAEAKADDAERREIAPFEVPAGAREPASLDDAPPGRERSVRAPTRAPKRVSEKQRPPSKLTEAPGTATGLVREIRAAMKELERGKSVAAYQRLQRAVSKHDSAN